MCEPSPKNGWKDTRPLPVRFTQQKIVYRHSTTQSDKLAAALKRADELRKELKKMRARLQLVTLLGFPVVVSDDLEKNTAIVFCGFGDLGKPIATKFINVGTSHE